MKTLIGSVLPLLVTLVDIDLDYDNYRFEAGSILTIGESLGEIPEEIARPLIDAGHLTALDEPTQRQIDAADELVAKVAAALGPPPEKPARKPRPPKAAKAADEKAADASGKQTEPGA